ncbi:c-type cytochrome [Methylococcus sp. EFPC2]|uniref:c-type cytochrome n=1 Tax=Methylococcus sp. EFPC2 TaxID=2812648 RepID=UPI001966DF6B|nr:c-type cytochrome [Methylococcus sp. EFPC2]QSA96557.1 c-type cytochrome [Methylococcus sp. EFPC2]
MRVLPKRVITALGLILLAGGMGAAHADRPKAPSLEHSTTSTTSTTSTSTADPILTTTPKCVTPTNDMAVEGRRAFMRMNCYSCHGMGGHGGGMGPSLIGEADEVNEAVLEGEGEGMPSYRNNLCPNDLANLTAYVQLLGTSVAPTFVNWWEPGLPSR